MGICGGLLARRHCVSHLRREAGRRQPAGARPASPRPPGLRAHRRPGWRGARTRRTHPRKHAWRGHRPHGIRGELPQGARRLRGEDHPPRRGAHGPPARSQGRRHAGGRPGGEAAPRQRLVCHCLVGGPGRPQLVLKIARRPEYNDRILAEHATLDALRHPRIVAPEKNTLSIQGLAGFLMERAGVETLAQRLTREGRLSLDLLQRFGEDLLEALQFLEEQGVTTATSSPTTSASRNTARTTNSASSCSTSHSPAPRSTRSAPVPRPTWSLSSNSRSADGAGTPPPNASPPP